MAFHVPSQMRSTRPDSHQPLRSQTITLPRLSRRKHATRHTSSGPSLNAQHSSSANCAVVATPAAQLFAQPHTFTCFDPGYLTDLPHTMPHPRYVRANQEVEIATLASGVAVLVSMLALIVFLGVKGNKDVHDSHLGIRASLRSRRYFFERWRVPSLKECSDLLENGGATLSRRGSVLFGSGGRRRRSGSTSSSYSSFSWASRSDADVQYHEYDAWKSAWSDSGSECGSDASDFEEPPHPDQLFIIPDRPGAEAETVRSREIFSQPEMVVEPKARRKNIVAAIAEWEAAEEEKYEALLARVREEEQIRELERARLERLRRRRNRSVSRGRSHSRGRLGGGLGHGRKMTVLGVPGEDMGAVALAAAEAASGDRWAEFERDEVDMEALDEYAVSVSLLEMGVVTPVRESIMELDERSFF